MNPHISTVLLEQLRDWPNNSSSQPLDGPQIENPSPAQKKKLGISDELRKRMLAAADFVPRKVEYEAQAQPPFIHTQIQDYVDALSDHGPQRWSIIIRRFKPYVNATPNIIELILETANLMNLGIHLKGPVFGNNPFNSQEPLEIYNLRKNSQINEIIQKISTYTMHVIALQEIDFIMTALRVPIKKKNDIEITEFDHLCTNLYTKLSNFLTKHEWKILTTNPNLKNSQQIPLAILYNSRVLNIYSQNQRYLHRYFQCLTEGHHNKDQFRGGGVLLYVRDSQGDHPHSSRIVNIINVHFLFDGVYNIGGFLESINSNRLTRHSIILGDFNHQPAPPCYPIMATPYATTFDANSPEQRGNLEALSHLDRNGQEKRYDAICVQPAPDCDMWVSHIYGKFFAKDPETGTIKSFVVEAETK